MPTPPPVTMAILSLSNILLSSVLAGVPARAMLGVFVRVLLGFQRRRARLYGPRLFRGCRLEPSRAACRERPHVAIPRETDHVHLTGGSRARPFGHAPSGRSAEEWPRSRTTAAERRARSHGRNAPLRSRNPGPSRRGRTCSRAHTRMSARRQRAPVRAPEPSSANPVLGCRGFDNEVHQAAARPACGIKMLRDFGECVDASDERQIVLRAPPQHEASRLQPVYAVRQGHCEDAFMSLAL